MLDRLGSETAWLIAALVAGLFIWFSYFAVAYWLPATFGTPGCLPGEQLGWRASGEPFLVAFILGLVLAAIGHRAVRSLHERLWWPILGAYVVTYISTLVLLSVIAPAIWGSSHCS